MIELFKKQIELNKLVGETTINEMNIKTYFNDEKIKIGDNVLYALLQGNDEYDSELNCNKFPLTVVALKEEHLSLFENPYDSNVDSSRIPVIILKKNEKNVTQNRPT